MLKKYEADHPGALNVTVKQSPIVSAHPDAPLASRAALCCRSSRQAGCHVRAALRQSETPRSHFHPRGRTPALSRHPAFPPRPRLPLPSKPNLPPTWKSHAPSASSSHPRSSFRANLSWARRTKKFCSKHCSRAAKAPVDATVLATTQPSSLSLPISSLNSSTLPQQKKVWLAHRSPSSSSLTSSAPSARPLPSRSKTSSQPTATTCISSSARSSLDFHPDSELANEAALAAGEQGKYWQMHDLLFANQSALKLPDLQKYAQQLNLDMAAFDEALATHRLAGKIAADRVLGIQASVAGTPTFIVDGKSAMGAHFRRRVGTTPRTTHPRPPPIGRPSFAVAQTTRNRPHSQRHCHRSAHHHLVLPTSVAHRRLRRPTSFAHSASVTTARSASSSRPILSTLTSDGRIASAALVAACFRRQVLAHVRRAHCAQSHARPRDHTRTRSKLCAFNVTTFTTDLNAAPDSVQADIDGAQRRGISRRSGHLPQRPSRRRPAA